MENSFASLISSANEVLILLPSKPYLDQVAAGLSLYISISEMNKDVSISCPIQMTAEFSRLIGITRVTSDLGNKNLTIKFVNYDANNVDKVSYDIENGQFKLTIAPKPDSKSPTKEQIEVGYTGTSGDLVILIGGANDSHFPVLSKEEFKKVKLVHVGTRLLEILNNDLEVLSFAKPASSTSELMASLLKESGLPIDADIATNLVTGIEEQSKNFQGSDVTAETFMVFAELLKLGGKRTPKITPAKNYPQGSIPTKPFNQPVIQQSVASRNGQVKQDVASGMTLEEAEQEIEQDIPPSWSEPKIFTGTSLS